MTRAAKPTRAEQMRRHREIFTYAMARGLTLIAAEKALVHGEWRAAQERLRRVRACGRTISDKGGASTSSAQAGVGEALRPVPADAPWMMRD